MIDLTETALAAISLLRSTFVNIRIDFSPAPAPLPVLAPSADVARLISLLAANAVQSMKGRGTLSIATSRNVVADEFASLCFSVAMGEYAVVAITDSGNGVSARVPGLDAAAAIAERHGGALSAHRTPGIGTVVRAFFPSADAGSDSGLPVPESAPGGTETVLLVEDEPALRAYLAKTLQEHGYEVLDAGGIAEAVEAAGTHPGPIHLLITDMALPGTSGAQVQASVESLRPGIVVLRISGQVERLAGNEDNILEKPFSSPILLQRIRRLLDSQRRPDAAEPAQNPPSPPSATGQEAGAPAKE